MKVKITMLICILAGVSLSSFAQKELLEGNWKFDTVSIVKSSDNSIMEVSQVNRLKSYFGVFDEMIFQGNDLTIVESGNSITVPIQITNDKIKISVNFTPNPIEAEYQIKEGKLFLTQYISHPGEKHPDNENYIILITYKKQ